MPRPDPTRPDRRTDIAKFIEAMLEARWRGGIPGDYAPGWLPRARRPRRKGDESERMPAEPRRPRPPLAGGAAAELEFDD